MSPFCQKRYICLIESTFLNNPRGDVSLCPMRMMECYTACLLFFSILTGCADTFRVIGTYQLADESTTETKAEPFTFRDAGPKNSQFSDEGDITKRSLTNAEALNALIAQKNRKDTETETRVDAMRSSVDARFNPTPEWGVPSAPKNMAMSSKQCLSALKKNGVVFERLQFETPLIDSPVLLAGPISNVRIGPHYQGNKKKTNAVMDCHLALAMSAVARIAETLGIVAIEFYSTYRPLKRPMKKKCPKGARRKKCLKKRRKYNKAIRAQKKSQHRFGRAIDIRWLKMADGSTLDVLEHFDRRDKVAPCTYTPSSKEAAVLTEFVCTIHRAHLFSVMLTPNANKDHHNHFHFDLTPRTRFNILR